MMITNTNFDPKALTIDEVAGRYIVLYNKRMMQGMVYATKAAAQDAAQQLMSDGNRMNAVASLC